MKKKRIEQRSMKICNNKKENEKEKLEKNNAEEINKYLDEIENI